jgi:hypothetical protein
MKQTAVDWLEKNIWEHIEYKPILEIQIIRKKIEQAKEMEREQIKDAFIVRYSGTAEEYYNETYNTNEK